MVLLGEANNGDEPEGWYIANEAKISTILACVGIKHYIDVFEH
ncbi:hypothetical protein OK016_22930 [Vibrio chagasii]|nr:hypothetical protein [Vibrio chagasii]